MPYTLPTLAQAQAALASRLLDPGFVHWTAAELTVYLREALRTWQAWTAHWRDQGSFELAMLTPFFDLPTVLPTLRAYTVTTWEIVTDLQYALLEPAAPGGTWTGTDQFTLAQLAAAIQRRRDQFLQSTGAVLTRSLTPYAAPPASGRLDLDEAVLTVRRAAWRPDATQLLAPLLRNDEWAGTHFGPTWLQSTQPPFSYAVSVTPPITLQLMPPTALAGTLDLVSVNKGAAIDPLVSSLLGVPDDWAWVVKYGALADVLSQDGLAFDPGRASYCEQRWQQGMQQAKTASVVLAARINGVTCRMDALSNADSYSPLWQLLAGPPDTLLTAGHNLLASWPMAGGGGPYTATLDVVRNAPLPVSGASVLQIGQDVYDVILDYAQHLALFKEGVDQLQQSVPLLERMVDAAGITLRLQQATQPSRTPLLSQTRHDEHAKPRDVDSVPVQ
jgi:hypothetical protein